MFEEALAMCRQECTEGADLARQESFNALKTELQQMKVGQTRCYSPAAHSNACVLASVLELCVPGDPLVPHCKA
jgi:hypothetical protein